MSLFGVGLLLLLWWPVSTVYYVYAQAPSPFRATWISSSQGALSVIFFRELPFSDPVGFRAGARRVHWIDPGFTPLPVVSGSNSWGYVTTHITIPLWLLAFLCLAWPVTSLLVARRRRRRGFAIVPLPEVAASHVRP